MCDTLADSRVEKLRREARTLLDQGEPRRAVRLARKAACETKNRPLRAFNLAAMLIDAGSDLSDLKLIREGIKLLKLDSGPIEENYPISFHYNLGTGYLALGKKERGKGPGTRPSLSEAVKHFDASLSAKQHPDTQTNLASALIAQGRWIEALDELDDVLSDFPDHYVALAKRGSALMAIKYWLWPHNGLLEAALLDYERATALTQNEPVFYKRYRLTLEWLQERVSRPDPQTAVVSGAEKWIWEHKLSLNLCPLCRIETPDAFDIFTLHNVLEGGKRRPTSEELLDLFNSLHRSFGTARWCLLQGMGVIPIAQEEQIIILPGSPSAQHKLRIGLMMMALSGFHSLLSQISFALNSYLHLKHKAANVQFHTVWSRPGISAGIPTARSDLHPAIIRLATPALSALYRLALSLERGLGRYGELRELRNHIEHHVVIATDNESKSSYFVTIRPDDLAKKAVKMGRIARAALWYFGGTVWRSEYERLKRAKRKGHEVVQRNGPRVIRI